MIKINLLETAKGKGKRASAGPSMPTMEMGDMGSPKLKILVIVVLVGLASKNAILIVEFVDVIKQLHDAQTGPVNLMAMMGETVNNTEAIWLSKLDDSGPQLNLEGTALSTDAVANLIANLQKTGFFRTVEIKETYQDETVKDMQAFQFTLTCDKAAGENQIGKGKS